LHRQRTILDLAIGGTAAHHGGDASGAPYGICGVLHCGLRSKEESSSFLKKGTKKL
jgi:hypothetical protein